MRTVFIFLLLQSVFFCREAYGLDIYSFIQPCRAKDPKLNDCVKETGQKFIPLVAKGVKEWNVPSIDPMITSDIEFKDKSGDNPLVVSYKNIVQTGFSRIKIENADVDLSHGVMTFKLKYPFISFSADYSAKGQLYDFDIAGSGKANISVWDGYSSFVLKYSVVSDHIKSSSVIIGFSFDKIFLDYTNITMNGDKELSESAGKFINENSAEIIETFKPELEKFYAKLTGDFLQAIFDAVPYSVLFQNT